MTDRFIQDPGTRLSYQHPFVKPNVVDTDAWRLTPIGAQRVQSGKKPKALSLGEWEALTDLTTLGGIADEEELQFESRMVYHPKRVMKRLQDLGYVSPVVPPDWEQVQQQSLTGIPGV